MDWCDAHAYCKWAGKRLCAGTWGSEGNASLNEWYNACSKGGTQTYPYPGSSYQPNACNGNEHGVIATLPVGSLSGCEGGYPGIYDMSGNVYEWTGECDGSTGSGDTCIDPGGSYYTSQTAMTCVATFGKSPRNYIQSAQGFRCCADVQ